MFCFYKMIGHIFNKKRNIFENYIRLTYIYIYICTWGEGGGGIGRFGTMSAYLTVNTPLGQSEKEKNNEKKENMAHWKSNFVDILKPFFRRSDWWSYAIFDSFPNICLNKHYRVVFFKGRCELWPKNLFFYWC